VDHALRQGLSGGPGHDVGPQGERPRSPVRIPTPARQPLRSRSVDVLLDKAGALLATSLDLRTTVERLADVIVPQFADVCAIPLADSSGNWPRLSIWREHRIGAGPATSRLSNLFGAWAVGRTARYAHGETRDPLLVERIDAEWLRAQFPEIGLAAIESSHPPRSALVLPLELDGRCLGAMLLMVLDPERPSYGAADLQASQRLAVFAAAAIRNARIWETLTVELATRRAMEDTLRESLATIGMLSSGLGHDMGNVVHALRLRLDSLQRVTLPEPAATDVRALSGVMDYLKGLTNGLQLLAGDAQAEQAGYAVTRLASWWRDAQLLLRNVLPHHVQIDWDCPTDLPPLRVPPVALTQIVFNLLQHCGQGLAGRTGARIRLRARHLRGADVIRLRVQDNGPGMSDEEVKATVRPYLGSRPPTGLGLPVAFALAERAGGDISVTSRPNRGTVFDVCLGLAQSARRSRDRKAGMHQSAFGETADR